MQIIAIATLTHAARVRVNMRFALIRTKTPASPKVVNITRDRGLRFISVCFERRIKFWRLPLKPATK